MDEQGDLAQRLEEELPDALKGSFDAQGNTVIPGYSAPAVDPEDAGTDLDAAEAEVKADADADTAALGADDTGEAAPDSAPEAASDDTASS